MNFNNRKNGNGINLVALAAVMSLGLSAGAAFAQPQLTVVETSAFVLVEPGDIIDYGDVLAGESESRQYILTNSGNQNLTIQSVVLLGQQSFDWQAFPIAVQLPRLLQPGQSMNIGVDFAPAVFHNPPSSAAIVQIDSSAPDAPLQFQVRGTVLDEPLVSALSIEIDGAVVPHNGVANLGEVLVGQTYEIEMIANSIGQIPLTLLGIQLAGANSADFQVLNGGNTQVAVGNSHTLRLAYTPSAAGQAAAIARILNNSAIAQYTINLSATVLDDCNANGIADEDDIADGTSFDCDTDGTPDECETDGDGDGVADDCDQCDGDDDTLDSDGDGTPDCLEIVLDGDNQNGNENENDNGGNNNNDNNDDNQNDNNVDDVIVPSGGLCGAGANMSAMAWAAALCGLGMGRRMQTRRHRR